MSAHGLLGQKKSESNCRQTKGTAKWMQSTCYSCEAVHVHCLPCDQINEKKKKESTAAGVKQSESAKSSDTLQLIMNVRRHSLLFAAFLFNCKLIIKFLLICKHGLRHLRCECKMCAVCSN